MSRHTFERLLRKPKHSLLTMRGRNRLGTYRAMKPGPSDGKNAACGSVFPALNHTTQ